MTGDGVLLEQRVIARVEGAAGRITLNRPKAINALTLDMVRSVQAALREFATDRRVRIVIVDGAGERGLCAGGDIRAILDSVGSGDRLAETFWREEYSLNAKIAAFPKPYVVVMDGLVFGGGVGIACHGSHRIATERLRLAMPEVSIGFVPDVGGSWLLSRAPGELGTYLALTGTTVGAYDARYAGLADHTVAAASVPDLVGALCRAEYGADPAQTVEALIGTHASEPPISSLQGHQLQIDAAFGFDSVEQILEGVRASPDDFLRDAAARISSNSPTSLKVALRLLRQGRRSRSLEECLTMEFRAAMRICRGKDFIEGVRAAVIDKNGAPRWVPASLSGVSYKDVDGILASLGDRELWAGPTRS